MSGYLKDQDATAEVWRNGWFHTGDYCYRDEDGYYHFVDRKKDMIRRSGENISASEVESVLSDHPDVLDAAVIAVPDSIRIEEVKAYVVPCKGASLRPEHLIQWCEQRLAYYKIPRFIEFRDSLPKTATQKIQKNVLKSEVEDLIAHAWDRTRHMQLRREKRR
jgi:acyl-CoA synthetase (AMP-forming)/AMP-acid ligase II